MKNCPSHIAVAEYSWLGIILKEKWKLMRKVEKILLESAKMTKDYIKKHENIQKFNEMTESVTVHFFGPSGIFHSLPF